MSVLKCTQCGHENDTTRVFCQNCGMRLERPEGGEATIAGHTPVMGRSKPQKKKFSLGLGEGGIGWAVSRIVRSVVTTGILAFALALIIQMGRKPAGIPDAQPANEAQASQLLQSVKAFGETVYPRSMDVSQAQANNYLAARIVADGGGGSGLSAKFERAFVIIGDNEMKFFVEQSFLGWPVFLYLNMVPETAGGGANSVTMKVTGGGVGHLVMPAQLVPLLERNLKSVIESTSDATAVLGTTSGIKLVPGVAKLNWQGSKKPGS